jgi:RNA polymerase sigma factor (sigma-70 family)
MTMRPLDTVLQHVHRLAAARPAEAADEQLLRRFVRDRDEAAFAALVQRHGPMVLGVCRRVLRHAQDAEDACQAAFLVLARKAVSIRKGTSLASWLHGVAYRIARKLQTAGARRAARQVTLAEEPVAGAADDCTWRDLRRVLDEELERLPASYAAPLVLCYLEGKTQDEAARALGWPLPTVRGRLERGRRCLRERLSRRGLTLSAALCGTALAEEAGAALPPALTTTTARAGLALAFGQPLPAATVSPRVLALAQGALNVMLLAKCKVAAAVCAAFTLIAVATVTLTPGAPAALPGQGVVPGAARPGAAQDKKGVHDVKSQVPPAQDAKDIWTLDFRFKDPRAINGQLPDGGKITAWYLTFQVLNNTAAPRTAILDFELHIDGQPAAQDVVLPTVVEAIARVEDPNRLLGLKNTITLADDPIAPNKKDGLPAGPWAVATWDLSKLDCQRFSIFVGGLSNGWVGVEEQGGKRLLVRRKTLQLNFKRVGDKYEFVAPPEWIYRGTKLLSVDGTKDADARPEETKRLLAEIAKSKKSIADLEQQRKDWFDERARLAAMLQKLGADMAEKQLALAQKIAAGDADNVVRLIDLQLLHERLKALEQRLTPPKAKEQPPEQPPAKVQGKVLAVDKAAGLVQINVGTDSGLKTGQHLEVYRLQPEPKYLGRLLIVEAQPGRAIGRPAGMAKDEIRPGDEVASSLSGGG